MSDRPVQVPMDFAALDAAVKDKPERVPPGWLTIRQWCPRFKKEGRASSLTTVGLALRAGVEAGVIETRKFRIQTNRGLYPTPHYRFAAAPAKKTKKKM